jgi:geranylgeranyl diphosphate synthase type II
METYLSTKRRLVNQALNKYLLPSFTFPETIHQAIRYSVLNGGKRLRAILALMTGELFGVTNNKVMPFACALEFIHAYSLVHDDLPAMDNDDIRRGKPTCHKVFGEPIAILSGDALLTLSFQIVAEKIQHKKIIPELISELARAAGSVGMIGGQVLDIENENSPNPAPAGHKKRVLEQMHLRKTAAMITVSARGAALISNARQKQLSAITSYARNLGLSFQIVDDILDISSSKNNLGKTPGKDVKMNKLTYPALIGLERANKKAKRLVEKAKKALDIFGKKAHLLKQLADYLLIRKR